MKLNHVDVWNLSVVNISDDDHGVVDVVNLHCVEKSVNVELSDDDVHLDDVVVQDVDIRADA